MNILFVLIGILLSFQSGAQESVRTCLTAEKVQTAFDQYPEIRARYESMQQMLRQQANSQQLQAAGPQQISIPVVVHIILNPDSPGQYVTDAQVHSQIRVLNEDFRKRSGTFGYNDHPDGADTQINFRLATEDPQGNPTNGIVRVNIDKSSIDSDTEDEYMKSLSNWDASRYLNIWVANVTGGVLGYAYYPGTAPDGLDGVVILYTAFGTTGSARSPFDLGRTATHEVGHYLNLIHVWGDVDGCNGSDQVTDTPPCSGQFFSGNNNSACTNPVQCFGYARQTENYMDYSDDRCMNMFTNGQSTRMNSALRLFRPGLLSYPAIERTVGVDYITVPDLYSGGTYQLTVSVRNNGSESVIADAVQVIIPEDNFTGFFSIESVEVSPGESFDIPVEITFETAGMKTLKVWSELPDDEFADDDTLELQITIIPNRPEKASSFSAYSDYLTPQSVKLNWTVPENTVNGLAVEGMVTAQLFRNDTLLTELSGLLPGGEQEFTDTDLITGLSYHYQITTTVSYLPDTADAVGVTVIAGGSLVPAIPEMTVATNGSVSRIEVKIPDVHQDQTPFHNPGFALLNRLPGGLVDSVQLDPESLGKTVRFFDFPVGKSARNYRYSSFLTGIGDSYFISDESDAKVIRAGSYRTIPWADSTETSVPEFLLDASWNIQVDPLNQNGNVLVYVNNESGEDIAVSPMIKVKDSVELTWKVNYAGAAPVGAILRMTDDFGKTWVSVDSVKKADLPEWQSGSLKWMTRAIRRNFGIGDTIVLSVKGISGDFYADNFQIKTIPTGVSVNTGKAEEIQAFILGYNYPNPFNPVSKIPVNLPDRGVLQVRLTDMLGREVLPVRELQLAAGEHLLTIDAGSLSSGVYLYEAIFHNQRQARLIQVIK